MAKLTKREASNYRSFGSTASLFAGMVKLSPVFDDNWRNATALFIVTIGVGALVAGWSKRSNPISHYLVPNAIRDW